MAGEVDTKTLQLRIDVAKEVLDREVVDAERQLRGLQQTGEKMADAVDLAIARMGTQFGPFVETARQAARTVQQSMEASFTDIQQRAAKAVQQPILPHGGFNLGSAEMRQAAEAAQQQAAAMNIIESAARRLAVAENDTSQATRAYLASLQMARVEAERQSTTLNQQAAAMERLEIETAQTGRTQTLFAGQNRQALVSTGQARAGMQQLGFQMQDLGIQFAMAAGSGNVMKGVMSALAMQGPQVVSAIAMIRGSAGGLIGFLNGPFGAAFMAAISLIAIMATTDDDAAEAKKRHKESADDLREAVDRLNNASASLNRTTTQGIKDSINAANAYRTRAIEARKAAVAELELAMSRAEANKQQAARFAGEGDIGARGAAGGSAYLQRQAENDAAAMKKRISELNGAIISSSKAMTIGYGQLISRNVEARNDPRAAAEQRYVDAVDRATREFEKTGDRAKFDSALDKATKLRDSTMEGLSERKKGGGKTKEVSDAEKLTQQYEQQSAQLADQLRIQMMRQRGLDHEADVEEARLALMRQFPKLDATRLNHLTEQQKMIIDQKYAYEEIMAIIRSFPTDLNINPVSDAQMQQIAAIVNADLIKKGSPIKQMSVEAQELARTINQDVAGSLKGMMRGFGDLGDMALNVLYSIGDALIDNLLNAGGGGAGGTGGLGGTIAKSIGSILGFDRGGYTGDGPTTAAAGVVHRREFVFDAATTSRIGVDNLEAIRRGTFRMPMPSAESLRVAGGSYRMGDTYVSVDARGAGPREVDMLNAKLDEVVRDIPRRSVEAVREFNARTYGRGLAR